MTDIPDLTPEEREQMEELVRANADRFDRAIKQANEGGLTGAKRRARRNFLDSLFLDGCIEWTAGREESEA